MARVPFHDVEPARAASADVLVRALDGEVFVLRRLLQSIDLYERIVATCRAGIARSGAAANAWLSASAGFDVLHHHVTVGDVPRITHAVQEALTAVYAELLGRLLRDGLGWTRALYAMTHPIPRFLLPYDATASARRELERFGALRGHGKVTALRPHRDSWFAESRRTVNIWIAVGPVQVGNGLSIYPEPYGRPLAFVPDEGVTRAQAVGTPVNFALAAGDVVVFHADHVHASELNRTDATRHVVSFRVEPTRSSLPLHPTERLRIFHPTRPVVGRVVDPLARALGRVAATRPLREQSPAEPTPTRGDGAIRVLSEERCAVQLADGTRRVLPRRCPHQGADLALGYVRDGCLVCPWHNLPFDLATGKSPCATIPPLRVTA